MPDSAAPTNAPPVWLLDIDGVINAATLGEPPTHAWPADDWVDTKADGEARVWRMLAARPVLDFIREVHAAGRAEIRWHTTWQERAANVARALDLPEFPVQYAPEFLDVEEALRHDQWWKLPAAQRVVTDEGRALLWTDDDADWDLTAEQRTALEVAGRVLIVSPSSLVGLCRRHLRAIDEFLGGALLLDKVTTEVGGDGPA